MGKTSLHTSPESGLQQDKTNPAPRKKAPFSSMWWCAVLLAVCLLLTIAARVSPAGVERYFSRGWYPVVARTYGAFTSLFPFSIAELSILCLVAGIPALLIIGAVQTKRGLWGKPFWKGFFSWIARAVCIIIFLFTIFCGLNYYRPTFADLSGLVIRDSSVEELAALCNELAQEATRLRPSLPAGTNGVMKLSQSPQELMQDARQVFSGLSARYEVFPDFPIRPKPVLMSRFMSMMQITGVFCPITFEANVNVEAPDYSIPATACHELAHTRGFMREDEANFIAYLACAASDSVEFQYSGTMLALVHAQNRLYTADRTLHAESYSFLSDDVRRDLAYNNAYWDSFEGPVAEVSTAVNNTYLRANNQSDGVQSYGRMVDLLLADYRQRHGLS